MVMDKILCHSGICQELKEKDFFLFGQKELMLHTNGTDSLHPPI